MYSIHNIYICVYIYAYIRMIYCRKEEHLTFKYIFADIWTKT